MKKPAKTTVFLALGALVGTLGLAGVAAAGGGGGGHHGGHDGFGAQKLLRLLRDLDLTEEQEIQAVRLRRQLREAHKANRAAFRADMEAVMGEVEKDRPDGAAIRATVDRAMDRMRTTAHQAIDAFLQLHSTLTPEQKGEIKARIADVRDRMDKRQRRRERRRAGRTD